jgi:serine/threonine protein kinase
VSLPDHDITKGHIVPDIRASQQVGPYRLIREIGRGGMGTVYLAMRADDVFQKRVAIKILKRGIDTDAIVQRFRNERQILASLEHPNIASLLDGGTTADGLPYFAMEYVEGQNILDYCEIGQLDTTARIELFRKVCGAVQYAHQNLIIHRDIKPANVLVASDGTPKLLDFGIAKLLNPELGGEAFAPTIAGPQLMTPEYAHRTLPAPTQQSRPRFVVSSRQATAVSRISCRRPETPPAHSISAGERWRSWRRWRRRHRMMSTICASSRLRTRSSGISSAIPTFPTSVIPKAP